MTFTSAFLPNGMAIGIDQNPHCNGVSVRVVIRSAARHDTVPGCAHFLEHCIAHSAAPSGGSVIDALEQLCLFSNFWTGKERILCLADTSPDHLSAVLSLFAHALLNPAYDAATLARERARILHEEDERRAATPAYGCLDRNIWGDHPFANTPLGLRSGIKALQAEDLEAFRHNHVVGSNMGIIISGPLCPEQTRRLIEAEFGLVPKGGSRPVQSPPSFRPDARLSIQKGQEMQSLTVTLQHINPVPEERASYVALAALLRVELDKRLSSTALNYAGAYTDYVSYSDLAHCEIGITVSPENAKAGLALVSATLRDDAAWLTPHALETLKKQWRLASDFNNNDPRQRVSLITTEYELTGNLVPWQELDARYDRVTIDDLREALHHLDLANPALLSVGPASPPWIANTPTPLPAVMTAEPGIGF